MSLNCLQSYDKSDTKLELDLIHCQLTTNLFPHLLCQNQHSSDHVKAIIQSLESASDNLFTIEKKLQLGKESLKVMLNYRILTGLFLTAV